MNETDQRSATYRDRLTTDYRNLLMSSLGHYMFTQHPGLVDILVDSAMGAVDQLLDELAAKQRYPEKPDVLRVGEAMRAGWGHGRGPW